jgi:hypothetical protein
MARIRCGRCSSHPRTTKHNNRQVPRLVPYGPWDDLDSDSLEDWDWLDALPEEYKEDATWGDEGGEEQLVAAGDSAGGGGGLNPFRRLAAAAGLDATSDSDDATVRLTAPLLSAKAPPVSWGARFGLSSPRRPGGVDPRRVLRQTQSLMVRPRGEATQALGHGSGAAPTPLSSGVRPQPSWLLELRHMRAAQQEQQQHMQSRLAGGGNLAVAAAAAGVPGGARALQRSLSRCGPSAATASFRVRQSRLENLSMALMSPSGACAARLLVRWEPALRPTSMVQAGRVPTRAQPANSNSFVAFDALLFTILVKT